MAAGNVARTHNLDSAIAGSDNTRITLAELVALRRTVSSVKRPVGRRVQAPLAGGSNSRALGRGLDFAEVREYAAGDDVRMIDWKVTARSGKPHTKIYTEERERPFLVVLDLRASMFFATRVAFKSVLAARLAAMIAWAAASNRDRVGGLVYSDDYLHEIKPATGSKGVGNLLREIVTTHANARNRLDDTAGSASEGRKVVNTGNDAFQRLQRIAHTGSSICMISDFSDFDSGNPGVALQLLRHNHVAACRIYDSLEAELPPPASYAIRDGQRRRVFQSGSAELRREYMAAFSARSEEIGKVFSAQGNAFFDMAVTDSLQRTASRILRALPGSAL